MEARHAVWEERKRTIQLPQSTLEAGWVPRLPTVSLDSWWMNHADSFKHLFIPHLSLQQQTLSKMKLQRCLICQKVTHLTQDCDRPPPVTFYQELEEHRQRYVLNLDPMCFHLVAINDSIEDFTKYDSNVNTVDDLARTLEPLLPGVVTYATSEAVHSLPGRVPEPFGTTSR
jgi:hypothetical protein